MMIPTTTWTEQSFCRSSKDVASSSREMIHIFSGKEITVARPNYDSDECHLQLFILDTPETTRQSTKSWLNIGTSVLARIMRRARRSCLAQIRIPTRTEETINIVHGPVDTMLFDTSSVEYFIICSKHLFVSVWRYREKRILGLKDNLSQPYKVSLQIKAKCNKYIAEPCILSNSA